MSDGFVVPKPVTEMTVTELIARFEGDIVYDCHGFTARFSRSDARKELVSRGNSMIPHVDQHLSVNPPSDDPHHLKTAWRFLREQLEMCAA